MHYYQIIITDSSYYYNIIMYYYIIIQSLLRHYYIIITSLFHMVEIGNNELSITYYAFSMYSLLHCYYSLSLLLPIITCYQLGNLQMASLAWDGNHDASAVWYTASSLRVGRVAPSRGAATRN